MFRSVSKNLNIILSITSFSFFFPPLRVGRSEIDWTKFGIRRCGPDNQRKTNSRRPKSKSVWSWATILKLRWALINPRSPLNFFLFAKRFPVKEVGICIVFFFFLIYFLFKNILKYFFNFDINTLKLLKNTKNILIYIFF